MDEPVFDSYVDRISNAKWEVKELGLEHNGFVSLIYLLSATFFLDSNFVNTQCP